MIKSDLSNNLTIQVVRSTHKPYSHDGFKAIMVFSLLFLFFYDCLFSPITRLLVIGFWQSVHPLQIFFFNKNLAFKQKKKFCTLAELMSSGTTAKFSLDNPYYSW